jgi:L-iditol 2-dehydrogenase
MDFVLPGVVKIPARNSFEEGAMLEPVNTVLKAVKRLNLLHGDNVLVAGQGPIGLMFTKILQLRGINVLATDLLESRLKLAKKFGAKWTALANSKLPTANSLPLDAAIIAVPSDAAVKQSLQLVRGAGQVLLFAHTKRGDAAEIDLASVCLDEKDLIGSYSADFTIQKEVAQLVFSRQLDVRPLISHRFPLGKTANAIALASKPTEDSLKIIVDQM